jgi:hypothetical protein
MCYQAPHGSPAGHLHSEDCHCHDDWSAEEQHDEEGLPPDDAAQDAGLLVTNLHNSSLHSSGTAGVRAGDKTTWLDTISNPDTISMASNKQAAQLCSHKTDRSIGCHQLLMDIDSQQLQRTLKGRSQA